MALDGTYAGLQASISDFLNRADLTTTVPDFIALAEADFNRKVRTRDMVARVMTNASTQYTDLPSNYKEMKFVKIIANGADSKLDLLDQPSMVEKQAATSGTTGRPLYYSVIGNAIELCPVPAGTYLLEMGYYSAIASLSAVNTTNWLLVKHPDLYLYGALMQSAPYLKDDERIPVWQGLYASILESIRIEEACASYSGATPRAKGRRIG